MKRLNSLLLRLAVVVAPVAVLLPGKAAMAYPNFISFGYGSCLGCHYNPFGNGPLTDYGRTVGATAISGRAFISPRVKEENIAEAADFFFGRSKGYTKNTWIRPQLNYRGLYLMQDVGGDQPEKDYITMDAGGSLTLKFLEDRLVMVGQIAYAPKPRAMPDADMETYRSREHYIGFRPGRSYGIYVGLMDKVFGLRVPDHIAYSRSMTGLAMNDQTHGAVFHYVSKTVELGVHAFAGNMAQEEPLRQRGGSMQVEVAVTDTFRLGASGLGSESDYVGTSMYAGHMRLGIEKGHSILLESGRVHRTPVEEKTVTSNYVFNQNHVRFTRGLFGILSLEAGKPNQAHEDQLGRIGLGLQYFPFNRLEMRLDVYNLRTEGETYATNSYNVMAQMHFWL